MKLYLAGPMSWIPEFNFPRFEMATIALRNAGFEVCAPHEQDTPEVRQIAWASPDGDPSELPKGFRLETAVRNTADVAICDGLALLQGWTESLGCRHEVETAHRFGHPVAPFELWLELGNRGAEAALYAHFAPEHPSMWRRDE